MLINFKILSHLPVFTERGIKIGQIQDVEINIENHSIHSYLVEPKFFGKEKYWVSPSQIKEITSEKVIVDDAVSTTLSEENKFKKKTTTPVLGAIMPLSVQEEKKSK